MSRNKYKTEVTWSRFWASFAWTAQSEHNHLQLSKNKFTQYKRTEQKLHSKCRLHV